MRTLLLVAISVQSVEALVVNELLEQLEKRHFEHFSGCVLLRNNPTFAKLAIDLDLHIRVFLDLLLDVGEWLPLHPLIQLEFDLDGTWAMVVVVSMTQILLAASGIWTRLD